MNAKRPILSADWQEAYKSSHVIADICEKKAMGKELSADDLKFMRDEAILLLKRAEKILQNEN